MTSFSATSLVGEHRERAGSLNIAASLLWLTSSISAGTHRPLLTDSVEKVGHGLRIRKVRVRD
jgi:hypothetical protein